jgi:hypothetical protein
VSSEETAFEATLAIDDNPTTFWHSQFTGALEQLPHETQIDLEEKYELFEVTCHVEERDRSRRLASCSCGLASVRIGRKAASVVSNTSEPVASKQTVDWAEIASR